MNATNLKQVWFRNNERLLLFSIFGYFLAFTLFFSFQLKPGIIPDEPAHIIFSNHYSTTWGIPDDTIETYSQGWYIKQNPFLYYWINGRIINFSTWINPSLNDGQLMTILRCASSIYAFVTLVFCYFLAKEIIADKWFRILPVFLLANTLMFTFLSGGVNYDNLTNLLSFAGLFFFTKTILNKEPVKNSLLWMIFIFLGTLTKFTVLPLATIMVIIWFVFVFKNKENLLKNNPFSKDNLVLKVILCIILIANLFIYGVNLVRYKSILPTCQDILSSEKCEISPFVIRNKEMGLEKKMTPLESIQIGYPNPVDYFFNHWIDHMLTRIYGIMGHINYFPTQIIIFYKLLFFWILLLGFRYVEKPSIIEFSFVLIILFYTFVVFLKNYNSELTYGFKLVALQGRYLFPVIGLFYVSVGYIMSIVRSKLIKNLTVLFAVALFLYGGPLKLIFKYQVLFSSWFH